MAKPKIRFNGYTEDWEQRKFGEIVEKYEDPVETPTEGYTRLGIRSHAKGTFHSYVEKGKELETAKMFRVAADKFIVNITFGWEHAVAITDENDAGKLVSHRFPQYSFNAGMEPKFFRYLILDENFKHHLELSSPGGAGRNRVLKLSDMLQYKMNFPSEAEQKKIAAYFDDLDTLITLHQRKCEQTKTLKKYMLQKMFPQDGEKVPQIRFEGFTEDWEQRKLGKLYQRNTERNENLIGYDKTISVATMSYKDDGNGASESSLSTYKVLRVGDIAFEGHTNKQFRFGRFVVNDIGTGIMSPRFSTLRPLNEMPVNFWKQYIHSESVMRRILVNSTKAGTMMNELVIPEFLNQTIMVPSENEQAVIGQYFTNLDHLITLHQRKCDELKEVKKFMLQNIFV